MSETFNVNRYWLERGRTYAGEQRLGGEYHRGQERFLLETLHQLQPAPRRILELGCGFGRITRLLAETFPEARITAVDLSPDQLANARQYCEGKGHVTFEPYDFYADQPFPGEGYDLAVAIEVFLHHPPAIIRQLIGRLQQTVPVLVHLDWYESWSGPLPPHVWIHDYPCYYRALGWEARALPVPAKVEGKQQVVFVAAARLPEIWRVLPEGPTTGVSSAGSDTAADSWEHQVAAAARDLCEVVPPGEIFILVDGDEWGVGDFPGQRRAVAFLENDGQYWGPPADDDAAWRALEELRRSGAAWLVIGWNARWWLDHYAKWHDRLRQEFPCVLDNDRLTVFKLRS